MKHLLSLLIFLTATGNTYAQECDTLYYDKDWKGVQGKAFASFYRVIPHNPAEGYRKMVRDYYITGELQTEGSYTTIDKFDDSKSVFDGELISYFKNGKKEQERTYSNGKLNGKVTKYFENGLINFSCNYIDDMKHGIYTEFTENGDQCIQVEYSCDKPVGDCYTASNKDGYVSKFRISDNKPIWESPTVQERKQYYDKGNCWLYYQKNGVYATQHCTKTNDYGKYYQIQIYIANNSMVPILFDPARISAEVEKKGGKKEAAEVLSADEYIKKVKRRQNFARAMMGISAGLAAANAGYSTSTTTTTYNGYGNSYGHASAYGTGGYATGSYYGNSSYHGTAISTTVTYDAAAAYQARMIASQQMADYSNALLSERAAKDEGYLKLTTVYPGESITGYINIKRGSAEELIVNLEIGDAVYQYNWNVK